ncbi:MAG: HTH-type transcriptional regulator KdgR [Acidimicrobiaceae bacterium]|nr:HTH-type transcriptional regulator KdgR [Acidimicrobiaceae bacterium]
MGVTYADIAKRCGVSTATVSRVLAGSGFVRSELAERVRGAAIDLGYRHNQAARTLRRNRSDTIGLVISDVEQPFFASIARAVEDEAAAQDRPVLLCNTDEDLERERMYLNLLIEERVAGVIVAPSTEDPEALAPLFEAGIPTVAVDRRISGDPVPAVLVDNIAGARALVGDLLAHGHRRIAAVTGTTEGTPSRERLEACRAIISETSGARLYEAEGKLRDAIGVNHTIELACRLATELMTDRHEPPTAFFCANGILTQGVLQALRRLGRRMPSDVALVGFDDLPLFSILETTITAAAQPTETIGRRAAQLLFRAIDDPDAPPEIVIVPPELRWRDSCGGGHPSS